ncbi:MAG: hypothetical protein HOP10_03925 [Chitinophagaceae bacterium]|nr:hypothetical protein [Chitinophagaceae bacterium]
MKKLFLIAAICFVTKTSLAQLSTQLTIVPMPPGTLIDWDIKTLTYIVSSPIGVSFKALIKTEIKLLDGTVVGTTDLARARPINVGGSSLILYAADVLPLDVMIFNGKFKSSLDKTGKLPADNYQICVQLVNQIDYRVLSEVRCRNFNIAAYQLPIPMMPANESVLDIEKAQSTITFRWTPVSPRPAEIITYRVTVFEILENQTAMQALRSNQPLLAKDVVGTTQYIWQPQLGMTKCCIDTDDDGDAERLKDTTRRTIGPDMEPDAYAFIWTIQTFDSQGRPFGDGDVNGDGITEPIIFFVDRRPADIRKSGPSARILDIPWKRN